MNSHLKSKLLYIAIAISFFISCHKKHSDDKTTYIKYQKNEALDSFAAKIKDHYKLPAIAIAFIHKDSIIDIVVKGKNKTNGGTDLHTESKFQIGSCGKAFTSFLVAKMIEKGFITWETRLCDVFKDMNIHHELKNVTFKQLLSHTSGIRSFTSDEEVFHIQKSIPDLKGYISKKRKLFTKWNLEQKPAFKVGEYHYSNAGYIIVAAMLEKMFGMTYENLMKKNVFDPLHLTTAEFGYPFLYDESQPYRHQFRDKNNTGITLTNNQRIPDDIFNPAGFISLSIKDFAQFVLVNKKILLAKQTSFDQAVFQELFKSEIKQNNNQEIALGWQIIHVNGIKTYGHTGSDKSIRAAMSIHPKTDQAIVFATNIGDEISEIAMVNVILELLNL